MKEFFRKKIVSLKRSPQVIALLILIVACAVFTFSLADHSKAATAIYSKTATDAWALTEQGISMGGVVPATFRLPGLYVFILSLFSILSVISYMSVYKRGKINVFMMVVTYAMLVIMIVCDIMYINAIEFYIGPYASKKPEDIAGPVANAKAHMIMNIISIVFVSITPLIKRLLNLIDTSVEDEYDKLMESKTEEELLIEAEDEA